MQRGPLLTKKEVTHFSLALSLTANAFFSVGSTELTGVRFIDSEVKVPHPEIRVSDFYVSRYVGYAVLEGGALYMWGTNPLQIEIWGELSTELHVLVPVYVMGLPAVLMPESPWVSAIGGLHFSCALASSCHLLVPPCPTLCVLNPI
jgi:hypothetical protein